MTARRARRVRRQRSPQPNCSPLNQVRAAELALEPRVRTRPLLRGAREAALGVLARRTLEDPYLHDRPVDRPRSTCRTSPRSCAREPGRRGSAGSSAGVGQRSSMYSRMMVESKIAYVAVHQRRHLAPRVQRARTRRVAAEDVRHRRDSNATPFSSEGDLHLLRVGRQRVLVEHRHSRAPLRAQAGPRGEHFSAFSAGRQALERRPDGGLVEQERVHHRASSPRPRAKASSVRGTASAGR